MINAGEIVDKREHFFTIGDNIIGAGTMENDMKFP